MSPRKTLSILKFILNSATLFLVLSCHCAFAADLTIGGKISDTAGRPVSDATVMVYHAGPTSGYSLFCPSCYADCGKRATTDNNGNFTFHHLNPGLQFELLVAKNGYEAKFVEKVIPDAEHPISAKLDSRSKASDPSRIFRGTIFDSNGVAQRDAVVQLIGELWKTEAGIATTYNFGSAVPGLDAIAVTDEAGTFEIDSLPADRTSTASGPPLKILVSVEVRGKAQAFKVIPVGPEAYKITVSNGAVIRGRLVQNGKPVGGVEVGLFGNPRGGWGKNLKSAGNPYQEIRIGTRPDGTFEIPNVPIPENWYAYAKMDSVASRGATGNIACVTKQNDELVDIGDVQLKPASRLRGRVVLTDGKPVANGMRITISSETAFDSQTTLLPTTGDFEFVGLAAGNYTLFASVKGYSPLPLAPIAVKTPDGHVVTHTPRNPSISIEHDVNNFVLTLQPDTKPAGGS